MFFVVCRFFKKNIFVQKFLSQILSDFQTVWIQVRSALGLPNRTIIRFVTTCADPEGGQGGPDPLKNYKNIGFLSNTGPNPLTNKKKDLQSQYSILGQHRPARETPLKWSRSPEKAQRYLASIQCRAIIGPPLKRH